LIGYETVTEWPRGYDIRRISPEFQRAQDRQAADLMERVLAGSRPSRAASTKR
jgi:hypothetical protein